MWSSIPEELRLLPQWVVSGPDKAPLNPLTGKFASVTDPRTWSTYEQACEAILNGWCGEQIGFVFTKDDPYSLIDIDDKLENPASEEDRIRHGKIVEAFDSYTEWSVSGRGCHIIVKGKVPSGVDRNHVGIYPCERYAIMTGKVIHGRTRITNCQDLLARLHSEATKNAVSASPLQQVDSDVGDDSVLSMACNAANATKFNALYKGEWEGSYPSQSEADLALISILGFYSPDNEQVRRLFLASGLGKRDKAKRKGYIEDCIRRVRASEPPQVDLSRLSLPTVIEQPVEDFEAFTLPPGLLGQIAHYIYSSAVYPSEAVALGGAITFLAGVCGRSFNISNNGLGQYVVVLATTGIGKEAAAAGMYNLVSAVDPGFTETAKRAIGPSFIASGAALIKCLSDRPCFVSIIDEFGMFMQRFTGNRVSVHDSQLKSNLTSIFGKSGPTAYLGDGVYSDREKNTSSPRAPTLSILGVSVPERFYETLDSDLISDGFLPRFTVLEHKGGLGTYNENPGLPPPAVLIQGLNRLLMTVQQFQARNYLGSTVTLDKDAYALMTDLRLKSEAIRNDKNGNSLTLRELWNRAHLKALKLAALVAVGCNVDNPVVDKTAAQWAINIVLNDIKTLNNRFDKGEVGTGDSKQMTDVMTAIKRLLTTPDKEYAAMLEQGIVPYKLVSRRVLQTASLRNDRLGATSALKKIIQAYIDSGEILEVPAANLQKSYNFYGRAFKVL